MSKYDPTEEDLGFNPYILDDDTHHKLNHTHYAVDNFAHRRRLNRWKEQELKRQKVAQRFGITYSPILTPASEILSTNKHSK